MLGSYTLYELIMPSIENDIKLRYVTVEYWDALCQTVSKICVSAGNMQILFAVLMGLRRGEINGLKYSDVDYINRTLRIKRQLGKKANSKAEDVAPKMLIKQEIKVKTESGVRELPIPDLVFEAILE